MNTPDHMPTSMDLAWWDIPDKTRDLVAQSQTKIDQLEAELMSGTPRKGAYR